MAPRAFDFFQINARPAAPPGKFDIQRMCGSVIDQPAATRPDREILSVLVWNFYGFLLSLLFLVAFSSLLFRTPRRISRRWRRRRTLACNENGKRSPRVIIFWNMEWMSDMYKPAQPTCMQKTRWTEDWASRDKNRNLLNNVNKNAQSDQSQSTLAMRSNWGIQSQLALAGPHSLSHSARPVSLSRITRTSYNSNSTKE